MDLWGIGCVFFELLSNYPLFPGEENELNQIQKIIEVKGPVPKNLLDKWRKSRSDLNIDFTKIKKKKSLGEMLSHVSFECLDLIERFLDYDPDKRITASEARNHNYFKEIRDQELKRYKNLTTKRRERARERRGASGDHDSSFER